MINSIIASGKHTMVYGGHSSYASIGSSGGMSVGNVRYNPSSNNLEVYDGYTWIQLPSNHASVGLTPDAESVIDWAMKKRNEELMLEEKAKTNSAIADLLNQRKTIDEQIKVIEILTKENKVGTN
jgi:hypothetical protein